MKTDDIDDLDLPVDWKTADYRSFADWKSVGYHVVRGSKAVWVRGKPLFPRSMVEWTEPFMGDIGNGEWGDGFYSPESWMPEHF